MLEEGPIETAYQVRRLLGVGEARELDIASDLEVCEGRRTRKPRSPRLVERREGLPYRDEVRG